MELTDKDKELIKELIDRGEPIPARYRLMLFADAAETELIWKGKSPEVTSVVLPFQSIEHIDEPRTETGKTDNLFAIDAHSRRQTSGWTNKLIWGDNKLVLSSLKNGPLRKEIESQGGIKLIYIDPPFDVGADFSVDIEIGEETITKEPSMIEELAYRDTWGQGTDSYLSMIYERLKLMRDLLANDGSIYVHCDWRVNSYLRLGLDETFSKANLRNEIVWQKIRSSKGQSNSFGNVIDTILFYSKSNEAIFNHQFVPLARERLEKHYKYFDEKRSDYYQLCDFTQTGQGVPRKFGEKGEIAPPPGKHWIWAQEKIDEGLKEGLIVFTSGKMPRLKRYLGQSKGNPMEDLWSDISPINSMSDERNDYATQKPEALLERILRSSSNKDDLVADFFCGSGTTLAVAEKLGRKWIGCDLGRFAIHTTRKRLIGVQRELKDQGKAFRSFEILNLGKYERQYFVGIDPGLPEEAKKQLTLQKEEHYLGLILSAYKAERVFQYPEFHGKKSGVMVVVGPIDAPVTLDLANRVVDACRKYKISKVDILGFEFEMSLSPLCQDEAKKKGVALSLKYIPKDVFDRRAVERGQVQFYEVAYLEVKPVAEKQGVRVELKDFGVYYRQDELEQVAGSLKEGGSKVTVESGQVVKIGKDKSGKVTRTVLTRKWTDWIDYWAVDFNYEDKKEIIRLKENGEEKEVWTGNYIFENEWQSFRTRKDRRLELASARHEYEQKGKYRIAVKVIDIFGNDTTKVIEVRV